MTGQRNRPPRGLSVLRRTSRSGNLGLTLPLPISRDLTPDIGQLYRPVVTEWGLAFFKMKGDSDASPQSDHRH